MGKSLIAFLFVLSACGDVGSSSITSNQQQGIGALPTSCTRNCTLTTDPTFGTPTFDETLVCNGFEVSSGSTTTMSSDCVFPDVTPAPTA